MNDEKLLKFRLAEKKAVITIISGLLAIIITVAGIGISLISWKNYQDYKVQSLIKKNERQDIRLEKLETSININQQQLSAINAKIDYMIRVLIKDDKK